MPPLELNLFSALAPARPKQLQELFGPVQSDAGWFRAPTWYEFSTPAGRFRLTVQGEEYFASQRAGLKGYALHCLREQNAAFHEFARKVDQFRSVYALHGESSVVPGDATFALLSRLAGVLDAVLFTRGTFFNPDGSVRFGPPAIPGRRTEPLATATEAQLQGQVRTTLDHPEPTAAQLQRRERNGAEITALGLPVLPGLPLVEDESEVEVRTVPEVVTRLVCILICAVKAEGDDQALAQKLIAQYGVADALTPEEREFVGVEKSLSQERAKFSWRYECAHVLQWWLGFEPRINAPHEVCDAGRCVRHIKGRTLAELTAAAQPRAASELLDAVDRYFRLHWAAVELRLKQQDHPAVDEGIVMERHRALNWLMRFDDAEWDDVPTDT